MRWRSIPAASLIPLDRHRHDDRGRDVAALDQLDPLDRLGPAGADGEVADLLAAELEGELRAGDVDGADVVGELDAVAQGVVLVLAVSVVEADDHRDVGLPGPKAANWNSLRTGRIILSTARYSDNRAPS